MIPLRDRWAASFIARAQVVPPEARECVTFPYNHSSSFFFRKTIHFARHSVAIQAESRVSLIQWLQKTATQGQE